MKPFTIGAVAYDPKVVTIWEGFKAWFADQGLSTDFVLYQNYERQVEGQFRGEYDAAWHSPLAWVQTRRIAETVGRDVRGFCMRDTDQDLTSLIVVRASSPFHELNDLAGRRVAVGAPDSPQATLIPLRLFHAADVPIQLQVHDRLFGKHGDHVGGERDAARALMSGAAEAACMIDGNHLAFTAEGTFPPGATRILARTEPYDHCIFTALDGVDEGALSRFTALLLAQRYDDPRVRPLLDLEGLKQWRPGRRGGFSQLEEAVDVLEFAGAAAVRKFIADAASALRP